jgi:hypothetical protein
MRELVNLWSPDSEPSLGVWIVLEKDLEEFEVVRELFNEFSIFTLKKTDKEYLNLSQLYLSLKYFGAIKNVSDEVLDSHEFNILSKMLEAIEYFKYYKSEKMLEVTRSIELLASGNQRYDRLIFFLESLSAISNNMTKTFFASIYGFRTSYSWWIDEPNFSSDLRDIIEEIKKLHSPFREEIMISFNNLKLNIDLFSSRNIENKFMVISAYCFNLATYFIKNKLFYDTYLVIHRSLDFYFTSCAIKLNLLSVKSKILVYYDRNPQLEIIDSQMLSLTKTFFEYVAKNDSFSAIDHDSIKLINKKRNSLLLTHGVECASEEETKSAYLDARRIMKGNKDWIMYLERFKLLVKLEPLFVMREILNVGDFLEEASE